MANCKAEYPQPDDVEALSDDDSFDTDDEEYYSASADESEEDDSWCILNCDDYDDETEQGLKGHYIQHFKMVDDALDEVLEMYSLTTKCFTAKCARRAMLNCAAMDFNKADGTFKKLLEMGIQASEMASFTQMHDQITAKLSKLKEISKQPEHNPDLHDHSNDSSSE